jgi:hypothetical protein
MWLATRSTAMAWSRRAVLLAGSAVTSSLAGCGGGGIAASSTPPPDAFEVTAVDGETVELRYTGIGSQDPSKFRVVLEGAGEADGAYGLATVTDDDAWSSDDRYVLDRTTLGLSAPLSVDGLTVELQYVDDGDWRTLLRANPAN